MKEIMTQDQRLDYLVEEFKTDSVQYENLQTPGDTEGKRRILRSLMNVRMPRQMPGSILEVQDEYLKSRRATSPGWRWMRSSTQPILRCWAVLYRCIHVSTTAFIHLQEYSSAPNVPGGCRSSV